jgi:hypothetical protein
VWLHGSRVERSSVQHLWIPGKFPTLNEVLDARTRFSRVESDKKRWNEYTAIKRGWEHHIGWLVRAQHLEPVKSAFFTYVFFEENKRRNPSNVVAVGIKIIEDALQKAGIIKNDGWSEVLGFAAYWDLDPKNPGTAVFLSPHGPLDRPTALYNDQLQRK